MDKKQEQTTRNHCDCVLMFANEFKTEERYNCDRNNIENPLMQQED